MITDTPPAMMYSHPAIANSAARVHQPTTRSRSGTCFCAPGNTHSSAPAGRAATAARSTSFATARTARAAMSGPPTRRDPRSSSADGPTRRPVSDPASAAYAAGYSARTSSATWENESRCSRRIRFASSASASEAATSSRVSDWAAYSRQQNFSCAA